MPARITASARRLAEAALRRRCAGLDPARFARVLVLAPHFDDEVLGCGGTILRLRAAGAEVRLVFATDGSGSHRHLLPPEEVTRLRSAESRQVAELLGLQPQWRTELGYPERSLAERPDDLCRRLAEMLRSFRPGLVLAPYGQGEHPDHEACSIAARRALAASGAASLLLEYPVWAWNCWPWVPLHLPSRSDILRLLPQAALDNLRLLRRLDVCCDVSGQVEGKRRALALYRSQTVRLMDDPRWGILDDVAQGQFTPLFFRDREWFHRAGGRLP